MQPNVFQDREAAYLSWLSENPAGYVLSTRRRRDPNYMQLHRSTCKSISQYARNMADDAFTGRGYIKVCSEHPSELLEWARAQGAQGFTTICSLCRPRI